LVKKISIVGTGALATFYSIKLSEKFYITLLGTWEEGINAINNGEFLEENGSLVKGDVKALNNWEDASQSDLTIWLTKSYKNSDLLLKYKSLGFTCPILILQNGIGQLKVFREMLGENAILIEGVTSQAAKLKRPGYVVNTGSGNLIIQKDQLLESIFSESGVNFLVVESIEIEKLNKLAVNAVLNPITALHNVKNGDAVKGEVKENLLELIHAVYPYFKIRNIIESEESYFNIVKKIAENTSENRNSMLMDVLSGRPTEIEQILCPIQLEVKSGLLDKIINKLK
jgi:2-dehydropantoate 2-reductase